MPGMKAFDRRNGIYQWPTNSHGCASIKSDNTSAAPNLYSHLAILAPNSLSESHSGQSRRQNGCDLKSAYRQACTSPFFFSLAPRPPRRSHDRPQDDPQNPTILDTRFSTFDFEVACACLWPRHIKPTVPHLL